MTKYTDDQINEAVMLANQTGKVYVWETEMYRDVIKHLPDQQDDWQECKFADIRRNDRVRWEVPASEDKESYEIIVRHLSEEPRVVYSNTGSYHFPDGVILYRIPAPVTPPDPAEHPVIIVHKELAYDFTQTPDGGQAMMWNGDTYENADYEFFCKDITDWTPAKVTPLED